MNITQILNALLTLFAALITAYIVPWLKNKLSAQQYRQFLALTEIAATAAQQLYYDEDGGFRKAFAVNYLKQCGYREGPDMHNAIEAAVFKLHNERNV